MKLQINSLLTAWPLLLAACVLTLVAARSALAADDTKYTVAAVQSELRFYASEEDFAAHMAEGMAAAMKFKPDLVVFPEDVGPAAGRPGDQDALAGVKSLQEAIGAMVHKHMPESGPSARNMGCRRSGRSSCSRRTR